MSRIINTWFHRDIFSGENIKGSSMTIPNLAPSLVELIEASISNGEPMPLCGQPLYDDDEDTGFARLQSSQASLSELHDFAEDDSTLQLNAETSAEMSASRSKSVMEGDTSNSSEANSEVLPE